MTLLAGIASLSAGTAIPADLSAALQTHLSRHAGDEIIAYRHPSAHLFKVDIGAFRSPGHRIDDRGAIMVAGEPLLAAEAMPDDRLGQVERLYDGLIGDRCDMLKLATGTYCGCFFDARTSRLRIFGDKLGVRPIYYLRIDRLVVYASAIRVLESIGSLAKELDLRGMAESACFGFPLEDRTAYENIKTIRAGEIVSFGDGAATTRIYWDWAAVANEGMAGRPDSPRAGWDLFLSAVRRRSKDETTALSFLSGGLDSRAIAGALTELDVKVASINFAPSDTQDQAFARTFAETIGAAHSEFPVTSDVVKDPHRTALVHRWIAQIAAEPFFAGVERPILWSGDGGSVGMGHVYLNREMLDIARNEGYAAAVEKFMQVNNWSLAPRIFRQRHADEILDLPGAGMRAELEASGVADRGKALYLFLMLNDQRRHLQKHFEAIDLTRLELHLPFFDADLLEFAMRSRIDDFIGHGFYMDWIGASRIPLTTTPWQAYPGHVPCPIPAPPGLKYQWGRNPFDAVTIRRMKVDIIRRGWKMVLQRCFPPRSVSRSDLLLVVLALMAGKAHLQYLVKMAEAFCGPAAVACRR